MSTSTPGAGSLISSLVALPERRRNELLGELTDDEAEALLYDWPLWARPEQLAPAGDWRIWLVLSGRGFGKTRLGAEWVRGQVREFEHVNLIAKSRDEYRDVMIEGESGILRCCPPHERPEWLATRRMLRWPNGARTLCFTAEEPEQLRGPQHQRLWGDEVAKWPYMQEAWDNAVLGLRLPPDPRALLTTTPKPVPLLRDMVERRDELHIAIVKGTSYENAENLDPAWFDALIATYEGSRLGRQELEAELLLDEGLAYRVIQGVHLVPPFPVDNHWHRFEALDYGTNNPCWLCFAVDYDGNVIVFGLENEPGLISEQAARIHGRREVWWQRDDKGKLVPAVTFAPPDIGTKWGRTDVTGKEMGPETEFAEYGITFARAQNDRRAGYARVLEMLKTDEDHLYPDWHPHAGEKGAPRLFILDNEEMRPLVQNLRDAPIEDLDSPPSRHPGEAVGFEWEHAHGHAHAALRYGLMSRPSESAKPSPVELDPRAARVADRLKRIAERQEKDLIDT